MSKQSSRFSGLLAALVLIAGCGPGGPDIAGVKGKVTMDGEPLANATVIFMAAAGGRPAAASTDENGEYELNFSAGRKGAIPGENRVRITTLSDPYEDEDGNPVPGRPETIPVQYNQQSTLTVNVVEGEPNVANFDLESKGQVINENSGY